MEPHNPCNNCERMKTNTCYDLCPAWFDWKESCKVYYEEIYNKKGY